MANLSQQKRQRMLEFLQTIREEHKDDDDVKAMYVSKNVLFTTSQKKLFGNIEIHIIPDNYFQFELKEIGETW